MARPTKPIGLYLHPRERVWIIRGAGIFRRTGCGEHDREGAHQALQAYLASLFNPRRRESDPCRLSVAEVLTAYGREHATTVKAPATIGYAIQALLPFWGDKTLDDVRKDACVGGDPRRPSYMLFRRAHGRGGSPTSDGTIRRELGVLQAAIKHWHGAHGPLSSVPIVSLPDEPPGRERCLERDEAARLVAGALGFWRRSWCDLDTRLEHSEWRRDRNRVNRHAARFILLGLATGTRAGAVVALRWLPSTSGGWIDLERGVLHRAAEGERQSNKRKPPARLGRRILAHLKRWKRLDDKAGSRHHGTALYTHVIHYEGEAIAKLRRAWESARDLAFLDAAVTPHVLRHTRATWLARSVPLWEAAGHLGMSVQTLEAKYGHHSPDWQRRAAEI